MWLFNNKNYLKFSTIKEFLNTPKEKHGLLRDGRIKEYESDVAHHFCGTWRKTEELGEKLLHNLPS